MAGLGHVDPHGAPLRQPMADGLGLIKLSVGPMDNNVYLIRCASGTLLIDAANDADRIDAMVGDVADQPPATIVTTHRHGDHLQALAELSRRWSSRLVAGRPDTAAIATAVGVAEPDGVWDGDRVGCGDRRLDVIGLVGHTPGSIALAYRPDDPSAGPAHLFTGDSLFPGGPGKTGSKGQFASLMDDLESKIFAEFGDTRWCTPGTETTPHWAASARS